MCSKGCRPTRSRNRVDHLGFTAGSCQRCASQEILLHRNLVAFARFIVLEPLGKFVGLVEYVLDRAWH